MIGQGGQLPTKVLADRLGAEFVVPFSSCSLALKSS